jgi:type IV fimbrial biogenesis protein FimT
MTFEIDANGPLYNPFQWPARPIIGKTMPPVCVKRCRSAYFAAGRMAGQSGFLSVNKAGMDKNNPQQGRSIRNRGFTLIEMMVTLALLAILIALVTPSFRGLLADNRATAQANALVGSLMLARSEAIKRNAPVVMCRSNDGASCAGSDWEDGWILWADMDRDDTLDPDDGDGIAEAGEEMILQAQERLQGRFDLSATGSSITYRPDGTIAGAADAFELVPPGGDTEHGRCIQIEVTGRPRVTKGACP